LDDIISFKLPELKAQSIFWNMNSKCRQTRNICHSSQLLFFPSGF
jgi:hypothetical protein